MSIQPKQQHSEMSCLQQQQQHLPRPSPFDELSSIFYLRQQETSSVGDCTGDQSPNSKLFLGLSNNTDLSEEIVKEGQINLIKSMEGSSPAREIQPPSLEDPETRSGVLYDHQIQVVADGAYYYQPSLLPPGFRFVPKDEELIRYYLLPFLRGYSFRPYIDIHHVDIYKYNPEQLAAEFKKGNDKDEWFFITERRKKYDSRLRPDSSANGGYWRPTVNETKVDAGKGVLGSKRTLVFHTGKQPKGTKTDWVMQEYHLDHPLPPSSTSNNKSHGDNKMLDTVLCKIYETPKRKKRRAYEEQEEEDGDEDLQRPSPMDELFSTFYLGQQESTSRVGVSSEDHSLNPNLSE